MHTSSFDLDVLADTALDALPLVSLVEASCLLNSAKLRVPVRGTGVAGCKMYLQSFWCACIIQPVAFRMAPLSRHERHKAMWQQC